jgi:hypothetical protein
MGISWHFAGSAPQVPATKLAEQGATGKPGNLSSREAFR